MSKLVESTNKLPKQEYSRKPLTKHKVKGASSKSIFRFMTTPVDEIDMEKLAFYYPRDVDDFERNRALLLWYPEWRERLIEMRIICDEWKNLVENWSKIEQLYDEDYAKHGNKAYDTGECCKYIRSLVKCKAQFIPTRYCSH